MAKSRRQNILDNIETIVNGLGILNTVEVNKAIPADYETSALPAVFINSGPDSAGEGQTSGESETWVWEIQIICITSDKVTGEPADIENLIAEVHRVVIADPTINNEVDRIERVGSNPDRSLDISGLLMANVLSYIVTYEQTRGEI